jgi:NADH-quinone oxidoreductase subunit I
MNEAIDMIEVFPVQNEKNRSGLVPRIDYGRCCWCALCSDVCPTKSLQMTPEYLQVDTDANAFLYMPKDE